ncbi:hypothetical protein [Flavimaricola marinus]|uniref:Lipoprotein n=1 Tax=Flavimaricola marinus TaxID=1819565 RepID=A0A238LDF0_9RHOB|nr:hypothetical protein [Flavimaricola marinus]SMY07444.1 hypothetical protein LOM8899_01579 [Flavimaricola marinus]
MRRPIRAMPVLMLALLAACGGTAPAPAGCIPSETLTEVDGTTMVMVNDCREASLRPATAQDLARMPEPL